MKHSTPDAYATAVALDLVTKHHFPKVAAVGAVQSEEAFLRSAHSKKVPVSFAAKRLADKAKAHAKRPRLGRAGGSTDLGPAGAAAANHAVVRTTKVRRGRGSAGMATGADACNVDPNWQPAIFGEDVSDDALETIDTTDLPSPGQFEEFEKARSSLPMIHQYWISKAKGMSRLRMPGALYTESTGNTKVVGGPNYVARRKVDGRRAAATYASISSSCPDECSLRDNGCYAQQGKTNMTIKRMDAEARKYGLDSVATAASEAFSILTSHRGGKIEGRTYLRVHVGGDSQTVVGTKMISAAIDNWMRRGGEKAWSYTHAWRKVPRSAWGSVSTLASIDDPRTEVAAAKAQGYVPAIVVDSFGPLTSIEPSGRRQMINKKGQPKVSKGKAVTEQSYVVKDFELFKKQSAERRAHRAFEGDSTGTTYIPCPAQVEEFSLLDAEYKAGLTDPKLGKNAGKGCLDCRLCFNDQEFLRKHNLGIMFEAHGPKSKLALKVLDDRRRGVPRTTGED